MSVSNFLAVDDWELFEALLTTVIEKQLGVAPKAHPLLMAVPPYSDNARKERTMEICFEKLGVMLATAQLECSVAPPALF